MVPAIGNATARATSSTQSENTVTVKKGDSLSSIAQRHNVSKDVLQKANPQLKAGKPLQPGQELKLPASSDALMKRSEATKPRSLTSAQKQSRRAEHSLGGQARAAQLHGQVASSPRRQGNVLQMPEQVITGVRPDLRRGMTGPDVKEMQQKLNVWRKANGKSPIPVTGRFKSRTGRALKNFQKRMKIRPSGHLDQKTKTLLKLETDRNYTRLSREAKRYVRRSIRFLDPSDKHEKRILQNVTSMAQAPGPAKFSPRHQKMAVRCCYYAGSTKNLTAVINSPNFHRLSDRTKTTLLRNAGTVGDSKYAAELKQIVDDPYFHLSSEKNQVERLNFHGANFLIRQKGTLQGTGGAGLSIGDRSSQAGDLQKMLGVKQTGKFGLKTFDALLDYQNRVGLPANGLADARTMDRLKLETNPNYKKLDPKIQQMLLNKLDRNYNSTGDSKATREAKQDVRNDLVRLANAYNFTSLSPALQLKTLQVHSAIEKRQGWGGNLTNLIAQPGFARLHDSIKGKMLESLSSDLSPARFLADLPKLFRSSFSSISPEHQRTLLDTFAQSTAEQREHILQQMGYIPPIPGSR